LGEALFLPGPEVTATLSLHQEEEQGADKGSALNLSTD